MTKIDCDSTIEYTPPRIGDWKSLRRLIEDNFSDITPKRMSHLIRNGMNRMLVARWKRRLVGFCYFEDFSDTTLHLLWLATDRNCYKRGVASRLLSLLDCYAINNGYTAIVLTVDSDNLPVKRLYEKLGYSLIEERRSENKQSWGKDLDDKCTEPAIKFSFWSRNYFPLRVFKKILYSILIK